MQRLLASLLLAGSCAHLLGFDAVPPVDQILARFEELDQARRKSMPGYTAIREYVVADNRFHVNAMMKVELTTDQAGEKRFRTLEVKGPAPIRKLVFQRMLDTEAKASTPEGQLSTRICRE